MSSSLKKLLIEAIDGKTINEFQKIIDDHGFLGNKGIIVTEKDLLGSDNYVLFASESGLKHIEDRHKDPNMPGSVFVQGINLYSVMQDIIQKNKPNDMRQFPKVKWLSIQAKDVVGYSGLSLGTPEQVSQMKDFTTPGGRGEVVKVTAGQLRPTKTISLITIKIGDLPDGREALSLLTLFPGENVIDNVEVPASRDEFTAKGFYFQLPPGSPALK